MVQIVAKASEGWFEKYTRKAHSDPSILSAITVIRDGTRAILSNSVFLKE